LSTSFLLWWVLRGVMKEKKNNHISYPRHIN